MKINNELYKQAENLAIMSPYTVKFWIEVLTDKVSLKTKVELGLDLEAYEILDINLLNQYGAWE